MRTRNLTAICSLILATSVAIPIIGSAQDKSAAEKAWKAGDPSSQPDRVQRFKERKRVRVDGNEAMDPMADPPPNEERMREGNPAQPREGMEFEREARREAFPPGMRIERRLMQYRLEAQRLSSVPTDVEAGRKRAEAQKEKGQLTPEREARLEKIAAAKLSLNELERAEFVDRVKAEVATGLKTAQEKLDGVQQKDAPQAPNQWRKVEESLTKINESTTSFEDLAKALQEMAPELPSSDGRVGPGGRDERMRREVEVLRRRIENLQNEYGAYDGMEAGGESPLRHQRPRPRINGDEDGMYQGLGDPPPAARPKDSQAGEKKVRSEQGNDKK